MSADGVRNDPAALGISVGMDRAKCPSCGYVVGLGVWSEPGSCPRCELPLMLTCEFRALSREEVLQLARERDEQSAPAARR